MIDKLIMIYDVCVCFFYSDKKNKTYDIKNKKIKISPYLSDSFSHGRIEHGCGGPSAEQEIIISYICKYKGS